MTLDTTNQDNQRFLKISTQFGSAMLSVYGGQLLSWKPADQKHDCLYLSPQASFDSGKAIRGGIPICWPWFGKRPNSPSHGIARVSMWNLDHVSETAEQVHIVLRLLPTDDMPVAFLSINIRQSILTMRLQTTARRQACTLTEAFHNYFRVGDLAYCHVSGLDHLLFTDFAQKSPVIGNLPSQDPGILRFHGPIDRVYETNNNPSRNITICDEVFKRQIRISTQGSASIIVWNPWAEGARQLADMPDGDWSQFICVEPANAFKQSVRLEPGHTHSITQTISVSPLS